MSGRRQQRIAKKKQASATRVLSSTSLRPTSTVRSPVTRRQLPLFIIEHCDTRVYEWSFIEYEHIVDLCGKDRVLFTNTENRSLKAVAHTSKNSVLGMPLTNACILDPFAAKTLSPDEKFDYYIFGGILGDNPPTRKTEQFLSSKLPFEKRNLGPEQMPTDNAVYLTKLITEGRRIEDIETVTDIRLQISDEEEVDLPYKYALVDGKPLIAKKLAQKLFEGKTF